LIFKDPVLKMLMYYKHHKNCGIVSCLQKNSDGSYEKSMRLFPDLFTLFGFLRAIYKLVNKKSLQRKFNINKDTMYPEWVSGALVFISREWFKKIGGWNEDYWMYFEDIDLSKKVIDSGGKIALLRNAEIIHDHGGSSRINMKTTSITKTEVLISKHVYIYNHFNGFKHFLLQLLVIINTLISKLILLVLGLIFFFNYNK